MYINLLITSLLHSHWFFVLALFLFLHADDRFVVKQMVSSWNIAEKDELLKFAPKYFDYMEKTHDAPTVLAKIFGFYTFKIKNGQSGQVMKIDVLVMEHLFFNQKITRVCNHTDAYSI